MKKYTICKNHPERENHCRGLCKVCYDKDLKARNPEYHERQKKNCTEWRLKHLEYVKAKDKARNALRENDLEYKEKRRKARLKKKYDLTSEDFDNILKFQNNSCAICEVHLEKEYKYLHIDHNHETGKVRGILCSQCNWFMSKIDTISNCFSNLEKYKNNDGVEWKKLKQEQEEIIKINLDMN